MRRAWIVLCATILIAGLAAGCATKNALESTRDVAGQGESRGSREKGGVRVLHGGSVPRESGTAGGNRGYEAGRDLQ